MRRPHDRWPRRHLCPLQLPRAGRVLDDREPGPGVPGVRPCARTPSWSRTPSSSIAPFPEPARSRGTAFQAMIAAAQRTPRALRRHPRVEVLPVRPKPGGQRALQGSAPATRDRGDLGQRAGGPPLGHRHSERGADRSSSTQFYSARLAEEVRRGQTEATLDGFSTGGTAPYGYRRREVPDPRGRLDRAGRAGAPDHAGDRAHRGHRRPADLRDVRQRGWVHQDRQDLERRGRPRSSRGLLGPWWHPGDPAQPRLPWCAGLRSDQEGADGHRDPVQAKPATGGVDGQGERTPRDHRHRPLGARAAETGGRRGHAPGQRGVRGDPADANSFPANRDPPLRVLRGELHCADGPQQTVREVLSITDARITPGAGTPSAPTARCSRRRKSSANCSTSSSSSS